MGANHPRGYLRESKMNILISIRAAIRHLTTLGFLIACSPGVQAETTDCTPITSVPTVISTQGVYCFTGHLFTSIASGKAIEITVNSVTIDMNGYKLGGLGAGDGTVAYGIFASKRKNIVIRNGVVRGFFYGILLSDTSPHTDSQGHLVEDVLADQNTLVGIAVLGRGNTLRRNQVVDTGGSTMNRDAYGMMVHGPGAQVLDNRIVTTAARVDGGGVAYGIQAALSDDSIIQNNRLSVIQGDGAGTGRGIYITGSDYLTVRGNTVTSADYGVFYFGSSGVYKDNVADNIAVVKYVNGTDGGGNF